MKAPEDLSDLLSKIYQNKVVLFIGNGASIDAGGPKTEELVTIIKKRFPGADYHSNDFIQTCTDVLETTLTSRADLEEVIRKKLYDLKPGLFHNELPLHVWPAIFTTNYDDLIEQGYRNTPNRMQTIDPVYSDRDPITLYDAEKVKLFKLMGCIVSKHPDNRLALTRADYNQVLRSNPRVFATLNDLMRDGTILYVGYSFQDYLLLDILDDIRSIMKDDTSYSYGLFPNLDLESIQAIKLRERKIIPLHRTAKELATILKTGLQPKLAPIVDRPGARVVIKGQSKVISHQDMRVYLKSFDFLYEEKLGEVKPDNIETRRDFFRGVLKDWTGFVKHWDFIRVEYDKVAERTKSELDNLDVAENKAILLFGPAGAGKTWMLRRLALDAYKIWGNPVVILRPYYEDIDLKLLVSLCEELSYLERGGKKKGSGVRARVLIIMENASSHVGDFKLIPTFMKSRGIPVLLMGSARENEWHIACEGISEHAAFPDSYVVNDSFESTQEIAQFANHLSRLSLLGGNLGEAEVIRLISRDYKNSFFESVYSLIEPARPLLDIKIKEEYRNLPPLAGRAYLMVASFYQYELPMPMALLVRALGCSYGQFIQQVFDAEAKKIICSVEAPLEGEYLGTRLRIIAEKLIEKEVPDPGKLAAFLELILSRINPRNFDEAQICRTLLIHHIGPNGTDKRFSVDQVRELFKSALDIGKFEDTAVLHHFGLFESDHGHQDIALNLTNRALKLFDSRQPSVFMRSERIENIYNTLGLIHMRKAEEAEKNKKLTEAENLYAAAMDYFSKAKGGELQTPHPYHCESRMHFLRAQRANDIAIRLDLLSKALDVIGEAEDNLPEESLPRLLELRADIQDELSKIPDLDQVIATMEKTPNFEIKGILLKAKLTLLNPEVGNDSREQALDILKRMAPTNEENPVFLRTYYKLYKELYPKDRESLFQILDKRYQIPSERRNFSLLYELGVLSFSFGDYPKSVESFRTLEQLSQGHPKRSGVYDRGTDKDGKVKRFQGTVVSMESRTAGHVDLPALRRSVSFIPYAQSFSPQVGDNVTYEIGFNYRGWLAIDLSK